MTDKSSDNKTIPIVLVTAFITLLGTLSTPVLSWLTASQTAKDSAIKYCQARVDADQEVLRLKGEAFLDSIGKFRFKLVDPMSYENYAVKHPELVAEALPISENAWRLSAYANPELGTTSIQLAVSIEGVVHGEVEARKAALDKFAGLTAKWLKLFQDSDGDFNKKRISCALNIGSSKS